MSSVPRSTPAHIAWLLPMGTLFFSCGILLGRSGLPAAFSLTALALAGVALLLSRRWRRTAAALLAATALGALLGERAYHPAMPAEGAALLRGTVVQEVAWTEGGQVQTVLSGVTLDGASQRDAYWTYYLSEGDSPPEWLVPGAQVEVTVRVYHPSGQENPGGFNFREYLLQRGVGYGVFGATGLTQANLGFSLRGEIAAVRHSLCQRLMAVMGEESGAYAAAMLLGTQVFLPADDRAAFQELGVAHILSVSGFHVGVLAGLLLLLLRPLPLGRGARTAAEAVLLAGYCLLTGGNAPVVRAALLLLWRAFTRTRRRQVLPLHTLCVAALVQLVFNPTLLTGPSFQLSYGAMLGLTLAYPWLRTRLACPGKLPRRVWDAFCASLAAQLGVLLPQLYWFGELPLLSLVLNMVVTALAGGLISLYWATLAALPVPVLREALGMLSAAATRGMLAAVRFLSGLPVTTLWTRQADAFTFAGWGLLLLGTSALLPRKLERRRPALLLTGTLLAALILLPLPTGDPAYTQFSVGDGDAAVLQDGGTTVVIDLGEEGQTVANYLHQRRQSVDLLILTHLHSDHAGGLRALLDEHIPVAVCCLPYGAQTPAIDEELLPLLEELAATGTVFRYLSRGDVLDLPSGQMTVLWPEAGRVTALHDANDTCLVLQAEINGVTLLLTGDLPAAYEPYIALPSDILKAAHHGSASATTADFLATVQPTLLLQSNRNAVREVRMQALAGDIPLYATAQCGAITIRFPGDGQFTVETMK